MLSWRELSGEQVYHIAHVENEMRQSSAAILARTALSSDIQLVLEEYAESNAIINDCQVVSQNWFDNIAKGQDTSSELAGVIPPHLQGQDNTRADYNSKEWILTQLMFARHRGIQPQDIAIEAEISAGYLSKLKFGRSTPSQEVRQRLEKAFIKLHQQS